MSFRASIIASTVVITVVACGPQDSPPGDDNWVGTITTEGNVTTVVNESGSVWGGTATLVEEASIGVVSGADEYMLDIVSFVYADERRIYVVQPGIPTVRLYDYDGVFVGDLGGPGQGPGEYEVPVLAAGIAGGRSFVYDNAVGRINVYDADGESVDTWHFANADCCGWPMAVSPEGALRAPVVEWAYDREGEARYGVRTFEETGPTGPVLWEPEIEYEPLTITVGGTEWPFVPFAPGRHRAIAPEGVVAGVTDQYRFELHRDDGTVMVVWRYWEPVPLEPAEAAWHKRWRVATIRDLEPGWSWNGDEIPSHKPAYNALIPAASGELWVARAGPSRRVENCVEDPLEDYRRARENPCWRAVVILDVFGADGRYLGEVPIFDGFRPTLGRLFVRDVVFRPTLAKLFVRDDLLLAVVEDEAGTIMVKRYRLVLPGEE